MSALGLGLVLLAVFTFRERPTWPGHWAVTPVLGAVLVIAAGGGGFLNRRVLAAKPAVAIGLISYPLYLWHWPILSYLRIINGDLPERPARLAAFALALLLSFLTYKFLEKPLRFGPGYRRLKVFVLAVLMAILGATGLGVHMKNGLPERAGMRRFVALAEQLERPPDRDRDPACFAYAPALAEVDLDYCRFNDIGAESSVALAGDSHAYVAYPGVARLGEIYGFNTVLMSAGGSPFALGFEKPNESEERRARLTRQTEAILATLAAKKDIRRVFIITMGWVYERRRFADGRECCGGPDAYRSSDYMKGLKASIAALAAAGKEVFLVIGVPQLKDDIVAHIIDRPFSLAPPLPPLPRAEALENRREYLRLAGEIENVVLIDPTDVFCPAENCLAFDEDGLPLYLDNNHLSAKGAAFQAERLLKKYLAPDGTPK